MKISDLFKLVRVGNLAMIAATQLLFYYAVLKTLVFESGFYTSQSMAENMDFYFILLVISTVFIAAAGYVANDIQDVKSDKLNNKKNKVVGIGISVSQAWLTYWIFNVIGLLSGLFSVLYVGKPSILVVHLLVAMMLYLYAIKYKCNKFYGNLFIAFSTSLVILLPWLFVYYFFISLGLEQIFASNEAITLISGYAIFSFSMTLLREWVKDIEDIKGDSSVGCRNTMVRLGIKRGKILILITTSLVMISVGLFVYLLSSSENFLFPALFTIVIAVLMLFVFIPTITAKEPTDFSKISKSLKLAMLAGIIFMIFYAIH